MRSSRLKSRVIEYPGTPSSLRGRRASQGISTSLVSFTYIYLVFFFRRGGVLLRRKRSCVMHIPKGTRAKGRRLGSSCEVCISCKHEASSELDGTSKLLF